MTPKWLTGCVARMVIASFPSWRRALVMSPMSSLPSNSIGPGSRPEFGRDVNDQPSECVWKASPRLGTTICWRLRPADPSCCEWGEYVGSGVVFYLCGANNEIVKSLKVLNTGKRHLDLLIPFYRCVFTALSNFHVRNCYKWRNIADALAFQYNI